MGKVRRSFLLFLVVVAAGCSSSSSTTSPPGPTDMQACADEAQASCTHLQSCSPADLAARYGDETTCENGLKTNCENALAAPSTGNDPSKTEGCAKAYAGWACADFLNNESIPRACEQATGALAGGAACAFPGQCSSGFCAIVPGRACGVCAPAPAPGDSCAQLTTCGPGLVCTTDTQTCAVFGASGAPCGKGAPCGAGLSCVGASAAAPAMGSCQAAVGASGAPCDPTQRSSAGCDRSAGLVCNAATKTCVALVFASGGQACGDVANQNTPCGASGQCSTSASGMMGTCTAAALAGSPCDLVNGPPCIPPARCIVDSDGQSSGTCAFVSASSCP
ncbi:MAG TPA: hypothetical protein VE987_20895 [Polyangiaceae bacterium]|nr:hypothetical protein [Polyangiaceae bacterium]